MKTLSHWVPFSKQTHHLVAQHGHQPPQAWEDQREASLRKDTINKATWSTTLDGQSHMINTRNAFCTWVKHVSCICDELNAFNTTNASNAFFALFANPKRKKRVFCVFRISETRLLHVRNAFHAINMQKTRFL
jgi:hypothetical protein